MHSRAAAASTPQPPHDGGGGNGGDIDMEVEEARAVQNVLNAVASYAREAEYVVVRWESSFEKLGDGHRKLLNHLPSKCASVRHLADVNQAFLDRIVETTERDSGAGPSGGERRMPLSATPPADASKVRYVLKDLAREWSAEGATERAESFGRLIDVLKARYPSIDPADRPRVLIPGCGLGRLVLEVANLGFVVEGNEFSYYMLFASAFMMNYVSHPDEFVIHPWILGSCNNARDEDQLRGVGIPDVIPESMENIGPNQMSICGGDFVEVYSRPDQKDRWDCVLTCFFMDTAHNVIRYIEAIKHCLKPGGLWINLGPALWHFADAHTYLGEGEMSIELSWQDVERIATAHGFVCESKEVVSATYTANLRSMMQTVYNCDFSVHKLASPPPA